MKKIIKCGVVAAVAVAAGFAAYQSYGSYGVQNNSLLMQNIEALAQDMDPDGDNGDGDGYVPVGYVLKYSHIQKKDCWKQCIDFSDFEIRRDYDEIAGNEIQWNVYRHYWKKYTRKACVLLTIAEAPAWYDNCNKKQDAVCDYGDHSGSQPVPLSWYE